MKPKDSLKKTNRSPGPGPRSDQFHKVRKGARLQKDDYLKYAQLSPKRAIILVLSIVTVYILIALAIAFTVSTTVALILSIPLIAIVCIAAVLYWLSKLNV